MASTYVNNLRLNEMATGDGSGTWGTTTNTNLELIGQALGYGTRAIANASTDNITIADGASDSDRAMYLKLTGGGQACTVTLLPNTASKVWMMDNTTSYTLTFTSGSGANVAILAGETKVIATDGAGSGGVVYDVLTDTNLAGHTKVDDLTVGDDLVVTDDMTVGGTLGVTGVLTTTATQVATGGITSGSSILSDTDSTDSLGSTGVRWLKGWFDTLTAGTLTIGSGSVTDSSGAISFGNENLTTTGIVTAAGTSVFTNLDISGDIDVDGTTNLDVVDIDGATQVDGTFTVGVDGTGHDVKFFGDTASAYMLWDQSIDDLILGGGANLGIGTTAPGHPLHISEAADGTKIRLTRSGVGDWDFNIANTPTLPGVGAGALEIFPTNGNHYFAVGVAGGGTTLLHVKNTGIYVVAGLEATPAYSFTADPNTGMFRAAADALGFSTGGSEKLRIASTGRQTYNGSSTVLGHGNFVGEVGASSKALMFEHTNGGGEVGTIVTGASSTAFNTSSDYRLKENVDYTWDATARLKQLKPARFNFIADETNTLVDGFLAHEVSSIVPEAISGEKDAMTTEVLYVEGDELPEGKSIGDVKTTSVPAHQGIDQSKLVPLLVKTIQELEARITTLEG